MRLWILSDLHLDVGAAKHPFALPDPRPEHDVVIIAGDICESMAKAVRWIVDSGFDKPVIYVAGNHDFYGCCIDTEVAKARAVAAPHPHIHILDNDRVDIGGVRFLGTTLWTDYELDGEGWRDISMMTANQFMNDHRKIRIAKRDFRRFLAADARSENLVAKQWLKMALERDWDGPVVVVTHHAPTAQSLSTQHAGSALNPAYASRLEYLVQKADLWAHGHVHERKDYVVEGGDRQGRVICNPRGYGILQEDIGYDPALVVDVTKK